MKTIAKYRIQKTAFRVGHFMLVVLSIFLVSVAAVYGEPSEELAMTDGNLLFGGNIVGERDISGVSIRGDFVIIGSDEGAEVQVLKSTGNGQYEATPDRCVVLDGKKCGAKRKGQEIDVEGIAWGDEFIYVIGSHSRARKSVDAEKDQKANRKRLRTTKTEPTREQLFRFRLDSSGKLVADSVETISLRNLFANHPLLALFQQVPSKENGIDIEGLAVGNGGTLYAGFRGPVLRGNFTPVLVLNFEDGEFKEKRLNSKIRYINLDGRGIRGMAEVEDGFLVLAGPVGDGRTSYQVYFWDGKDTVPGQDKPDALKHRKLLCRIPTRNDGAKAEGIALIDEKADHVRFVVVYDSATNGDPSIFRCQK